MPEVGVVVEEQGSAPAGRLAAAHDPCLVHACPYQLRALRQENLSVRVVHLRRETHPCVRAHAADLGDAPLGGTQVGARVVDPRNW
eukprot:SAG31_NODE_3591_length_4091_cov_3.159068_6_plen_86_part_00